MRAAVLALLVPIGTSCSKRNDDFILVPVDGVVRLRDGPALANVTVGFFEPARLHSALSPLAPEFQRGQPRRTPPLVNVVVTDAEGRYGIRMPPGPYEVWVGGVADSGIMSLHAADAVVRLPAVALDLHYVGYRMSGRLLGPGGVNLPAGTVFVQGSANTARASVLAGVYSVLLPAGAFDVRVTPTPLDYEAGIPRVRYHDLAVASDTTIDLALDGYEISGRVSGPGGIPLAGGWISARATNDDASAYMQIPSNGVYRIFLPGGTYDFTINSGPASLPERTYPSIDIDADRTLDFDLSGPPPPPPPGL